MIGKSFFYFLILFLLVSCKTSGLTQSPSIPKKARKFYIQALEKKRNLQYKESIALFGKAITIYPTFGSALLERGRLYFDRNEYDLAEQDFNLLINNNLEVNNGVNYALGVIQWEKGAYEESISYFSKFLESEDRISLRKKAEKYIRDCEFAQKAILNPVTFDPIHLGPGINTKENEYLPALTAETNYMVFSRRVAGQEDLFFSVKADQQWMPAQPVSTINTPYNEGAHCITLDGKLILFTSCDRRDGMGSCDIYYSFRSGDKYGRSANLGIPINTRYWDAQPSLSENGTLLFFSSDRPGGKGGRDIWFSRLNDEGNWSSPVNPGFPLNSSGNEESPFIHADGKTLYFMSDGHPGMGDFDLFISRYEEGAGWQLPVNLGYPINTKGNEGSLSLSLDGKTAFFASDQKTRDSSSVTAPTGDNAKPNTDIFSFELYPEARPSNLSYFQAIVLDALSNMPMMANIRIIDLTKGSIVLNGKTDPEGEILIALYPHTNYGIHIFKHGYTLASESFDLSLEDSKFQPLSGIYKLFPISENTETDTQGAENPIILKNIFFESGSYILKKESDYELTQLYTLLKDNPGINIRINGHTDNIGSEDDNDLLSMKRAEAVYSFLIKKGIEQNRISFKGFGESKPIDTNDTENGRKRNRRTEFEIIE